MKKFFVTATNTDIGKTFISSILFNHLGENSCYYKPIQTGCEFLESKLIIPDVDYVREHSSNKNKEDFKCTYPLKFPLSPHLSSRKNNINIDIRKILEDFREIENFYENIIVEGAGGIFSPINTKNYFMYNLIKDLNLKAIVITSTKVGTINDTILTINHLKNSNIKISGVVFNNFTNKEHEIDNISFLTNYLNLKNTLIIPYINKREDLNKEHILKFIENL